MRAHTRFCFASVALFSWSLLCGTAALVEADEIVVPNAQEFVEGDRFDSIPFMAHGSIRYQQIYGASDFSELTGPVSILELRFRPDADYGAEFESNLYMEITLSTTPVAVDQLSNTFADNLGSDAKLVRTGWITISSSNTGSGPQDFDIAIPIVPYMYDPAAGNLLLDIKFYGGTTQPVVFDAQYSLGDSVSRVFANDVFSQTADEENFGTLGLVTKFVHTTVPNELVVPNALTSVEGNTNNIAPFSTLDTVRYQQIYGASEFSSLDGPILISELRFRPDVSELGLNSINSIIHVEITLSTTKVAVDQLSNTFADNIGSDATLVRSWYVELTSGRIGPDPQIFDISIKLSTPFLYDPAAGNLLMDVKNFGGGSLISMDAQNEFGDSVSRVAAADVNSPTANFPGTTIGLVTKFVYTPVERPVPDTIPVVVDVEPGDEFNSVKLNLKGKSKTAGGFLRVAVLTTDTYDATTTDVDTVLLGDPDLPGAAPPSKSDIQDVDNDGDNDLLLVFRLGDLFDLGAVDGDTLFLELNGTTIEGVPIKGMDFVMFRL